MVLADTPDLPPSERARWICRHLRPVGPEQRVRLTGYYRPVLPARRQPGGRFRVPLYGRPPASVCTGRDCPDRAAIDRGALRGKAPVVAWLADPVDAYFLHVQGSGLLRFEDGSLSGVGWDGSNERPYRSIGKLAVERGWLPPGGATMAALRRLLRNEPVARRQLFDANPRYVFFRETDGRVIGSAGIELVAGRSVAADNAVHPAGSVLLLERRGGSTRIVFVHDTGAAIQGPRLDLYTGTGAAAGLEAGSLNEPVGVFPLLLSSSPTDTGSGP